MSQRASLFVRGCLIAAMIGVAPGSIAASQETAPVAAPAAAPAVPQEGPFGVAQAFGRSVIEEAHAAHVQETDALEREAAELDPGEFVWRPERSRSGPVEVVVSLQQQRAYVYRANVLIGVTTVSTGRRGHRTPTGTFPILERKQEHYSNLYNNAPMPYMQRLTWDGIALHAGALPGYPASHGCVRLPLEFSRILFGTTSRGSQVHIVDGSPPSAHEALAFATGRQPARATIQLASAN